jgi:hypothetical protein
MNEAPTILPVAEPPSIDEIELIQLKRKKLQLISERVALRKRNGLLFYVPLPKQDAFHRAAKNFKLRMYRAGNRSGKSTCGCTEVCAFLLGERCWYPVGSPERTAGIPARAKVLLITSDWDVVNLVWTEDRGETRGKLWTFLPKEEVAFTRRNHTGVISEIGMKNGAYLRFETVRSWMTNPLGVESADWDLVAVDEPCPQRMFTAAARGLIDRQGQAFFTLTPLSEFWINDLFFPEDTGGTQRPDAFAIDGTIYDNTYLSRTAIDAYASLLTDDEKSCRLLGIPMHLAGLIYKDFRLSDHVLHDLPKGWENWATPPKDWPVYYYIDPHPHTPHCVIFLTVDELGNWYIFDDIFTHCIVSELAANIHGKLAGKRAIRARIDPCAFIEDPITGTTMAEDFARCGIVAEPAVKDLDRGILAVGGALKTRRLRFTPQARRSLWEIQRYAWDQRPGHENHPIDKDDHAMECLYRAVLDNPTFVREDKQWNHPVPEETFEGTNLDLETLAFKE